MGIEPQPDFSLFGSDPTCYADPAGIEPAMPFGGRLTVYWLCQLRPRVNVYIEATTGIEPANKLGCNQLPSPFSHVTVEIRGVEPRSKVCHTFVFPLHHIPVQIDNLPLRTTSPQYIK